MEEKLRELRDSLLHTSEYKTIDGKLAYANGVLDMYNAVRKVVLEPIGVNNVGN